MARMMIVCPPPGSRLRLARPGAPAQDTSSFIVGGITPQQLKAINEVLAKASFDERRSGLLVRTAWEVKRRCARPGLRPKRDPLFFSKTKGVVKVEPPTAEATPARDNKA